MSVFECKDSLYYMSNHSNDNYTLAKVTSSGEILVMQTGIDFAFVDAVYFNKCEIFINDHNMLVVRPGENLSEKTLDDLVEITYDFSLAGIVKAFDKLFVFGTNGHVLASSDEVRNEESLSVKTMSAYRALYEAKAYVDEIISKLEMGDVKYADSAGSAEYAAKAATASKVEKSLTFTGNATGTYDGSAAKTVNIPDLLTSVEQVNANTAAGHGVDARVIKEINGSLNSLIKRKIITFNNINTSSSDNQHYASLGMFSDYDIKPENIITLTIAGFSSHILPVLYINTNFNGFGVKTEVDGIIERLSVMITYY